MSQVSLLAPSLVSSVSCDQAAGLIDLLYSFQELIMSLMVFEAQKPCEEEVHPHLNRMNSGLGASYAFHCGDGSTIQRTDGNQTGVG